MRPRGHTTGGAWRSRPLQTAGRNIRSRPRDDSGYASDGRFQAARSLDGRNEHFLHVNQEISDVGRQYMVGSVVNQHIEASFRQSEFNPVSTGPATAANVTALRIRRDCRSQNYGNIPHPAHFHPANTIFPFFRFNFAPFPENRHFPPDQSFSEKNIPTSTQSFRCIHTYTYS